jgi:hypothetical protein
MSCHFQDQRGKHRKVRQTPPTQLEINPPCHHPPGSATQSVLLTLFFRLSHADDRALSISLPNLVGGRTRWRDARSNCLCIDRNRIGITAAARAYGSSRGEG